MKGSKAKKQMYREKPVDDFGNLKDEYMFMPEEINEYADVSTS